MSAPYQPAARPGLTRFAQRGSTRLAYEATGASGLPVVALLHDLLGDRGELAGVRDALVGAGDGRARFRVVAPDARGHGASAAIGGRSLTVGDLAGDLLAVLDAEGVERAHLVGRGLGGAVAFAAARRAPGRVRSLTLVEPAVPGVLVPDAGADRVAPAARVAFEEARAVNRAAAEAAYKGLTDKALDGLLDPRWGAGWRERLPRPRLAAVRRHAGALASVLGALDAYVPGGDDLREVAVPTLVVRGKVAGTLDRLVGERLVAGVPGARAATIPAAADPAAPLVGEAGAALAALVAAFLAEREAAGPG